MSVTEQGALLALLRTSGRSWAVVADEVEAAGSALVILSVGTPGQMSLLAQDADTDALAGAAEFRVSDDEDPRVDLALIGIDTDGILRQARYVDDAAARRRAVRDLLWEEMDVSDSGELVTAITIVWRGTARRVELVFANVRDEEKLPWQQFEPGEPGAIRIITDYPFDEGNHSPAEDVNRVKRLPAQLDGVAALVWLPHFLSARRLDDLSDLIVISHVLKPGVLDDLTPNLTAEDRHHTRLQLDSRRAALKARMRTPPSEPTGSPARTRRTWARAPTPTCSASTSGWSRGPRSGRASAPCCAGSATSFSATVAPGTRTSTPRAAGRWTRPSS